MSMRLSMYAGEFQPRPEIEIREEQGAVWLEVCYPEGGGVTFHGRSRAQCERLAVAWLGMWDEPAEVFTVSGDRVPPYNPMQPAEIVPLAGGGNRSWGSPDAGPDAFARGANMQPGLPDRIVRPDDEPHGVLAELDDTTQEWR